MLTDEQLKKIMPHAPKSKRTAALPILNKVMADYDITNEKRVSAFLATIAIESGELKYQEEIASGSAYEGRKNLGNNQKGDGRRFKGRGRIQVTGRSNYQAYTNYLKRNKHLPFIDFVAEPQKLALEPYATDAAGWFFAVYKKLNSYADKGDFYTTQIRVNGMNKKTRLPNHWVERQAYNTRALSVLPSNFTLSISPSEALSASGKPAHSTPLDDSEVVNDVPQAPEGEEASSGTNAANGGEFTEGKRPTQTAENITNVSTGDKNVPDNFQPELKEQKAPEKEGTTSTAVTTTVLGLTVPPVLVGIVKAIQSAFEQGWIDAKQVFDAVMQLLMNNLRYVPYLIALILAILIIKKVFKQLSFLLAMYINGRADMNDVKIVPDKLSPAETERLSFKQRLNVLVWGKTG